jgi:Zn-dependent protease
MADETTEKKRGSGLRLARIAGIQITLDYSWFVIFILVLWGLGGGYFPRHFPGYSAPVYWAAGLAAAVLFFLSIFLHELAHSLVAIRYGIRIPEITFFIFGGVSKTSQEPPTPDIELKMAAAGPAASFLLALLFRGVQALLQGGGPATMASAIFGYLSWLNFVLGVFNLVPGFPLDGGRVLRALWWKKTGSVMAATRAASAAGKGFGLVLMLFGGYQFLIGAFVGGLWLFFIGLFLRSIADRGYRELVIQHSLEGVNVQDVMLRDPVGVPEQISVQELVSEYFFRYGYRGFPVIASNGEVTGIVTLDNVQPVPAAERENMPVRGVMSPLSGKVSIGADRSLADALRKMGDENTGRLLVLKDGRVAGMITKAGLLRFLEIRQILDRQR